MQIIADYCSVRVLKIIQGMQQIHKFTFHYSYCGSGIVQLLEHVL